MEHRKQLKVVSFQDLSVLDLPQVEKRETSLWEEIGLPSGHLNCKEKGEEKKRLNEAFYNSDYNCNAFTHHVVSKEKVPAASLVPLLLVPSRGCDPAGCHRVARVEQHIPKRVSALPLCLLPD